MDQNPAARDTQVLVAQSNQSVTFSDAQFDKFLATVQQRRQEIVGALHALTNEQKNAAAMFEGLAAGIGVGDFVTPLPALVRSNDRIAIRIPDKAVRARVYSEAGVEDISLEDCREALDLTGRIPTPARVGRVEFFNAQNRLLEVTGGEPVQELDRFRAGR